MSRRIVTVNTGSSTLKLAIVDVERGALREIRRIEQSWAPDENPGDPVRAALEQLHIIPDAFGHRVVHGGAEFVEPVTLTPEIEQELEALVPLAPLHNGPALAAIREVRKLYAGLPSVAVFDTAFHADRPGVSMRYALPGELVDRFSMRRYGFHGLAHESLVGALAEAQRTSVEQVDAVTLQLGAGCSACAVREGRSIETSMGYTPLEGLVMTTRSGNIDPAIVLRLMRADLDADAIENALMRRSGLHALCGLSDMREILAASSRGNEDACFALDLFCHRIVLAAGAYFTLLGGKGALIFGGGIGANSPEIRERVCGGLGAWGVELDPGRNTRNEPGRISVTGSRPVYALPTNEEAVVARAVCLHLDTS